jgi:hypothetical protein
MSDTDPNPNLRPRDAAEGTGARRLPAWASDNAYPPGRDAAQRFVEKRIAEKRRAVKRKSARRQ